MKGNKILVQGGRGGKVRKNAPKNAVKTAVADRSKERAKWVSKMRVKSLTKKEAQRTRKERAGQDRSTERTARFPS